MDDEIYVSNVQAGIKPVVITCDVRAGGVLIHGVSLRAGRNRTTYLNMPRQWQRGRWVAAVEVVDAALLSDIRVAVALAASEATRFA